MQPVSDSASDSSSQITVGTPLMVLAGQVQYFPYEACLYYKKNVMFENECLCSVCAGIQSRSEPSCHIVRVQSESQSCGEHLLAKFFHAATTVHSLSGFCQQRLSPSQDHQCERASVERQSIPLCIHQRRDKEAPYYKTVITELTEWAGVGKNQLRDEAKRPGEKG